MAKKTDYDYPKISPSEKRESIKNKVTKQPKMTLTEFKKLIGWN